MNGKKLFIPLLALVLLLSLTACGGAKETAPAANDVSQVAEESGDAPEESAAPADGEPETKDTQEPVPVRIGSLKGPTSIGLAQLRSVSEAEEAPAYQFALETDASALLAAMVSGDLDVALIPANAAAIWNSRLEEGVTCIDVNTLGVLYVLSGDDSVTTVEDLAGRTVYLPGQGTSPDYVLQYLLAQHGMSLADVTVEYQSEAAEVIAALTAHPDGVGVLPQPSVTAALSKLEGFTVALDLTEEWGKVCDTDLLTGVTVVRNGFLAEHPDAVAAFLEAHAASTAYVAEDVETVARLTEEYGIMDSAAVAERAIPLCNVTCVTDKEMRDMVSAYLQVLYDLDPASVGGALPEDSFYYLG